VVTTASAVAAAVADVAVTARATDAVTRERRARAVLPESSSPSSVAALAVDVVALLLPRWALAA
jgi:hypothetical protein